MMVPTNGMEQRADNARSFADKAFVFLILLIAQDQLDLCNALLAHVHIIGWRLRDTHRIIEKEIPIGLWKIARLDALVVWWPRVSEPDDLATQVIGGRLVLQAFGQYWQRNKHERKDK